MEKNTEEIARIKRGVPILPIIITMFIVVPVLTFAFLWGTVAFSPDNIKRAALSPEISDPLGKALTIATGGLTNIQMAGKACYDKYCAVCHGEQGKGDGFNAYNLDPKPKDISKSVKTLRSEALFKAIYDGITGQNDRFRCPPWGRTLGESKINAVISYLLTLEKTPSEISNTP